MVATFLTVLLYVFLVIFILIGVVLVLMIINHFLLPADDNESDTSRLRHDVETDGNVISRDSLFHTFLGRDKSVKRHDRRHAAPPSG